MDAAFHEMLTDSAMEASNRARWILTVAIVASVTALGAVVNFGFSVPRFFVTRLIEGGFAKGPVAEHLQRSMIKSGTDELSVSVNIIGLHFSAADAGVIGGVALVVVSTWMYGAFRRENHIVGRTPQPATQDLLRKAGHDGWGVTEPG